MSVSCELPSVVLLLGLALFALGCYLILTAKSKVDDANAERDELLDKMFRLRVDYDLLRAATPFHYKRHPDR